MSKPMYSSLLCPSQKVTEEQLETDRQLLSFEHSLQFLNRRNFLSAFIGASAVGAVGTVVPRSADAQSTTPAITDVLNFALNLEYLEANFYSIASTGSPIAASVSGSGAGAITNSPGKLPLDATTQAIAVALAKDELNHVQLLQGAISSLGGTPIPQPAINFGPKGIAIQTQVQFLSAARQFTALGGSAYCGSAVYLVGNTSVLTTAAQILGAEGQHAGALNYQCVKQGVASPAIDPQDVPPSSTNYFTVLASNALSPARTTSQVLGVAYGVSTPTTQAGSGVTSGGFFPNGVNGNIKST